MNDLDPSEFDVDTLAIRSAQLRTDEMAHSDPIFLTSSFVYESAAQAAARFGGYCTSETPFPSPRRHEPPRDTRRKTFPAPSAAG